MSPSLRVKREVVIAHGQQTLNIYMETLPGVWWLVHSCPYRPEAPRLEAVK